MESVVPICSQSQGLQNRPPSFGEDGENQQFSKSVRAGDFHSEKTKLMKENNFQLLVIVICPQQFQYHVGFLCLASESLEKFFLSKGFSVALSTVNMYYSESLRERCVMNSGINRKGSMLKKITDMAD